MSSEYLFESHTAPNTDHPDACIRLAAVVHRFRVPQPVRPVSFRTSFSTVGQYDKTRRHMSNADDARRALHDACTSDPLSAERVVQAAQRYQPAVHSVLISCKVQPEQARLDEKLVFEWTSGVEAGTTTSTKGATVGGRASYSSEAIMYDVCMTVATEGLGHALAATERSVAGDFATAARSYAAAAGVFYFLSDDQLPKWISKGTCMNEEHLPLECHAAAAKALHYLFQANGQQMAVATVLIKPGVPNYSLLAKLCLGISEQLDNFISLLRREAFQQMGRLDKEFLTLIAFQIAVQASLSLYFQARAAWDNNDHGIAIALLSEASVALRTRSSIAANGVPDVTQSPALKPLDPDLQALRKHYDFLLHQVWEKDNNMVYFETVPQHVPAEKKLLEGLHMNRKETYQLQEVEPVLLVLPEGGGAAAPPPAMNKRTLERSDSDLARELQRKWNLEDGGGAS